MYDIGNILNWFKINVLKANPKRIQFTIPGRSISDSYVLNIDGMEIMSTDEVTSFGVAIENS